MTIATLDLLLFTTGTPVERRDFSQKLLASLKRYGFVKFVNHGISEQTVTDIFYWTRSLFDVPIEEKLKVMNLPGPKPQRGWSCVGAEKTGRLYLAGLGKTDLENVVIDIREHFDQGAPSDKSWPTRWPEENTLPGFRAFMEGYYEQCRGVSQLILSTFEVALDVSLGTFTSCVTQDASETRLLHYPAVSLQDLKSGISTRTSPHTDLGVITCLFQDDIGGLEVRDQETGNYVPVENKDHNEMVVNVSETFQRWTNDGIKAGVHRVTYPRQLRDDGASEGVIVPARYSNTYFVKADRDTLVGTLEAFQSEEQPSRYKDITALEYHQSRVATAYSEQEQCTTLSP